MVDESIIVSVNDRIAPSIAVNFKKIASNAAMAGAAVDQFKAKLATMGAGNFAAITAGIRGVTAEIMAQSTALDLLAKKQALLGGIGGAIGNSGAVSDTGNKFIFLSDQINRANNSLTRLKANLVSVNAGSLGAVAAAFSAVNASAASSVAVFDIGKITLIGAELRNLTALQTMAITTTAKLKTEVVGLSSAYTAAAASASSLAAATAAAGRSRQVNGAGSGFSDIDDNFLDHALYQAKMLNIFMMEVLRTTTSTKLQALELAAAYGAAAAAAAKIKPSAIPSGGAGSIGRDMRDATNETNRFNQSQRDMLSIMSGSGGTAAATRLLAGGFGMAGAAAAVAAIAVAKLSDTYIIVNAQTSNATSNALEASIAVDSLRKIAADTGAPLKDLARSFGRFNYALAENNVPMSRTLEMTQTITNALKMNGATTQEASSAMLQFSQALGKGYMNGDEFRNMMETMPMVARQVASSMGIAFGQLKDAASAGKVTWDVLLDAITDPAFQDDMKRKADAVQLFQYSWQSFVDKVTYSIGQFDKLTGTSSMVKGALDLMGDGAASAGEKLEALDNTFQALSISSSNAISRLSAQFPALQSAVNSFNSSGFIDELKKMVDYASSPMMANLFKLLSIGLSGVTKIGDDFATRKTAMSTLMPGYSMTGETKSTEIPKFGMSKPVEMNMDMIVRDKRLAELVKAYQSYELKQSEFESKFNDIVYGKSGSGKKSRGVSTAINGAILDAQEAQKAYENLIEKGLSPGDKILSDMAQHMGKLNEAKREHVRLIAYEADELEFLKVINEEVYDQREQLIKRDAELSEQRLAGIKYENERYAALAIGAMDVKKSLMTDEQRILSEATDRWAQYTEMVKAGFLDQADAVRAYVNEFDENAQMMKGIGKSLQSAFADYLFNPFDKGLKGMVENFGKAILRMKADQASAQLMQMAGNWGASVSGSGGLMGMIGSGLAGMFGGVAAPMMPMGVAEGLIGDLVGFDGGGYTGSAPRSGGLDGKGGFMAMLHPRETVVDHTKGQKVSEQKQTNIFNFTINGSPASRETQAQMANRVASVLNSGRRIS